MNRVSPWAFAVWFFVSCLVAVPCGWNSVNAQAPPEAKPAPTLTVEQKQAIQILAQRIEIAQLRAQAAQLEFDKARDELATLMKTLGKDGYVLNLQTMAYEKSPPPGPPTTAK